MRILSIFTQAILLLIGGLVSAQAESLKILDGNSLVRALKQINQTALVEIETKEPDMKLYLQSMDKLQAEIEGEGQGKTVIFREVTAGTWRITGSQNGISKVTIKSGQN